MSVMPFLRAGCRVITGKRRVRFAYPPYDHCAKVVPEKKKGLEISLQAF
ncbi:hypothetical protein ACFSQU_07550 [Massilia sp. GCM10020059]|uniref:Uncharacterized protein n=1 Tax=Massilia agrisoli TaxID=2892444 RepID=A0ABS8IYJ6_9BURK|nr:hypothetical protein [Massilia agrisoli]MCC6072289.1 hypothetical protein [Massilia agrisoli]